MPLLLACVLTQLYSLMFILQDDYHYGTTAAVAGGTTCLVDFVIPGKDESLVQAYRTWEEKAAPKINCDIAFHMAITYFSEAMLEEMATVTNELGVQSYKFFMAYNASQDFAGALL